MKLYRIPKGYALEISFDNRGLAKSAGFEWDGNAKRWWTPSQSAALKFTDCANPELKAELLEARKKSEAALAASYADDVNFSPPCPEGFSFYPFQRAGIFYGITKMQQKGGTPSHGVLIADEMGLGKTCQAIGILNCMPDVWQVLIVCPASLRINWMREWERVRVETVNADGRLQATPGIGIAQGRSFFPDTAVVICNFDILKSHLETIHARKWDAVIVDEAHYIKGGSQRSKALMSVKADYRIALTGTPILNKPIEIFNVLKWLRPDVWSNKFKFAQRYCELKQTRFGMEMKGASNLDELQAELRSTCLTGDTEVYSEYGKIKISEIVSRRLQIRVWSSDQMGRAVLRKIVGFNAKANNGVLIKIRHTKGSLTCTGDHKICLHSGKWIRADQVKADDALRSLRKGFYQAHEHHQHLATLPMVLQSPVLGKNSNGRAKTEIQKNTAITPSKNTEDVRALRREVYGNKRRQLSHEAILHRNMPREMDVRALSQNAAKFSGVHRKTTGINKKESTTRTKPAAREGDWKRNKGKTISSAKAQMEKAQRNSGSSSRGKAASVFTQTPHSSTRARALGLGESTVSPRGSNRCLDEAVRKECFCGYSSSFTQPDNRSGRPKSCYACSKSGGQNKRFGIAKVRVLDVKVLEVGDRGRPSRCPRKNKLVYDIEVGGTHNFFANGILVHNCMIRRRKQNVLKELPPKTYQVIELPADGVEADIQNEWAAYTAKEQVLLRLRVAQQLAKASDSDDEYRKSVEALKEGVSAAFAEMAIERKRIGVKKIPFAVEHLKDIASPENPVVAFTYHHEVFDGIAEHFKGQWVGFDGRIISTQKRQNSVDIFQQGRTPLFLGGMQAAGVGITLTVSNVACHVEEDWTPAILDQCADRLHRIGQRRGVLVQYLVFEGSLGSVMMKRTVEKQKIIDAALNDEVGVEHLQDVEVAAVEDSDEPATAAVTRKQVVAEAMRLLPEDVAFIHATLQIIAGMDSDYAHGKNAMGFNKVDSEIGHSLAEARRLTPRMSILALKFCHRYRGQLPAEIAEELEKIQGNCG